MPIRVHINSQIPLNPRTPPRRKQGKKQGKNLSSRDEGQQQAEEDQQRQQLLQEEEEGLLDHTLWSYVSHRTTRLLREGLGNRCVLARPLHGVAGEDSADFEGGMD